MAQALTTLRTPNPFGIVSLGKKLIIGTLAFDFDKLTQEKFKFPSFITGMRNSPFRNVAGIYGDEFLFTPLQRVNYGSFHMNPNNLPNVAPIFVNDDGSVAFVVNVQYTGGDRYLVNLSTYNRGTVTGSITSSYQRTGIGIKINDTDIVSIIGEERYDKAYIFTRDSFDGYSLMKVHSSKWSVNYASYAILWNTASKVYAGISYNNNTFAVLSYNITTQGYSNLKLTTSGRKVTRLPSGFLPTDMESSVKRFYTAKTNSQNNITIELWTIDIDNNTANSSDCSIDWAGFTPTINVDDGRFALQSWITQDDNSMYLHIATIVKDGYNPSDTKYGIYSFTIDANDPSKLTFINFTEMQQIKGLLALNSKRDKLVINTNNDVYTAVFVNGEWNTLPLNTGRAGVILYDREGRLWIIGDTLNPNLYLLTPQLPLEPKVWFEPDEVIYNGTKIPVKVYVDAFNIYGERVAVKGRLVIVYGDLEFEDGSKEKSITTSTSSPVAVDAYVTGSGDAKVLFVVEV